MSKADKLFVDMCQKIIDSGMSSEGQIVRPRWEDGTPAHTIKTFGVVNRYNLLSPSDPQLLSLQLTKYYGFGKERVIMYMT